jgi:hypothetical protein
MVIKGGKCCLFAFLLEMRVLDVKSALSVEENTPASVSFYLLDIYKYYIIYCI